MNTGAVANRYAKALLLLTQESGRTEQVFSQACALLQNPDAVPAVLEPDLEKLMALLIKNGRQDHIRFVLTSYIGLYREFAGIVQAKLITAVPAKDLEDKFTRLIQKRTGGTVMLESKVDPSIIGGFILQTDRETLDASVRRKLNTIRRQLSEKNIKKV